MNKSLKVLFIASGIYVFAEQLLGPLYAVYVGGIDKAVTSVSISWATFMASSLLFTYLISLIGDKVKETEYLLVAGYTLKGIIWFLYIFVTSFPQLVLLQVLLGFSDSLHPSSFVAILAKHLDKGKYVTQYAKYKLVSQSASVLGILLGGAIVSNYGFSPLFVLMSILSISSSLFVLSQPRRRL